MAESNRGNTASQPPENAWAPPTQRMKVPETPGGAMNLNVEGRQPASPLAGFRADVAKNVQSEIERQRYDAKPGDGGLEGQLLQKFQPPENRFYPTMTGIQPGSVLLIEAKVPPLPGMPSMLPVATGCDGALRR